MLCISSADTFRFFRASTCFCSVLIPRDGLFIPSCTNRSILSNVLANLLLSASTFCKASKRSLTIWRSLVLLTICSSNSNFANFSGSLINAFFNSSAFNSPSLNILVPLAFAHTEFNRDIFSDNFCQVKISELFSINGMTILT